MTFKKVCFTLLVLGILIIAALTIFHTKQPVNLILISIDTLRADRLGCYGYEKPTSPNIDRFARQCYLFTNAISQSPWTLPSHMSIFTSLYPSSHKVGGIERSLDPQIITLAQIMKKAGYQTAGFVDAKFVSGRYGFRRGFDVYNNRRGKGIKKVLPRAVKWLRENYQKPFFLFFHVFDCHCPYNPPEKYSRMFSTNYRGDLEIRGKCGNPYFNSRQLSREDVQYISSHYDGEIRHVDTEIQGLFDLLEELNLYPKTLVILLSDHGEELREHGQIGHQRSVYNELMHIPLLLRLPGRKQESKVVRRRIEAIDIMPTILDFLGLKTKAPLQGKSFLSLMKGEKKIKWEERAFGELNELAVKRTLYDQNYQYIYNVDEKTEELYDRSQDPEEQINLAGRNREKCQYFKSLLNRWGTRAQADGEKYQTGHEPLDNESLQQLRTLGYIE